MANTWLWIGFNAFVLLMLALDLGVFHRKEHKVTFKEAISWSVVWIVSALIFNGWIYYDQGKDKALEFLTGYLIENHSVLITYSFSYSCFPFLKFRINTATGYCSGEYWAPY